MLISSDIYNPAPQQAARLQLRNVTIIWKKKSKWMNESVEEAALSVYMLHSNDKFWGIEDILASPWLLRAVWLLRLGFKGVIG